MQGQLCVPDGGSAEEMSPGLCRVYEALEEYKVLLNQPDEKVDVLMGAALIAQHRYPLLVRTMGLAAGWACF